MTGNPDVDATAISLERMMGETQMAMHGIAAVASTRADEIATEMRQLGIPFALPETDTNAVGGPLLPATDELNGTPMLDDANAVMSALLRYKAAREASTLRRFTCRSQAISGRAPISAIARTRSRVLVPSTQAWILLRRAARR